MRTSLKGRPSPLEIGEGRPVSVPGPESRIGVVTPGVLSVPLDATLPYVQGVEGFEVPHPSAVVRLPVVGEVVVEYLFLVSGPTLPLTVRRQCRLGQSLGVRRVVEEVEYLGVSSGPTEGAAALVVGPDCPDLGAEFGPLDLLPVRVPVVADFLGLQEGDYVGYLACGIPDIPAVRRIRLTGYPFTGLRTYYYACHRTSLASEIPVTAQGPLRDVVFELIVQHLHEVLAVPVVTGFHPLVVRREGGAL